jgi:hypothetical protein
LNRLNGIKISPYKDAPRMRANDVELIGLQHYLIMIADWPSLAADHSEWKAAVVASQLRRGVNPSQQAPGAGDAAPSPAP